MHETDTIAAIATPPGMGALAIIRLSGPDAFDILGRCLMNPGAIILAKSREVRLYTMVNPESEQAIDHVTAIKYSAPRSFTGENMVEIISHGGPRVVREIMDALLCAGAKPAGRGAFTRRALMNGKIDLLRAEAIKGMIESRSEVELTSARKLYSGNNQGLYQWRDELLDILAHVEAGIEFEDEVHGAAGENKIRAFVDKLEKELKKRKKIKSVENFFPVVIAGPANAGKSTLFNTLLGYERAIVHNEPGTTRDGISERVEICGYEIELLDSAGFRQTENKIEQEGISRSRAAIEKSAIIIWVTGANEPFSDDEIDEISRLKGKESLYLVNKTDLYPGKEKREWLEKRGLTVIETSLVRSGVEELVEILGKTIERIFKKIEIPDMLFNDRHEEIGQRAWSESRAAIESWDRPEICAYHLKRAISCFDEFFGENESEEVLGKIFETFCIGK